MTRAATAGKIVSLEQLQRALVAHRESGKTIALANGLFDVLHVGHLRYLEGAAAEADVLVVALNADESARTLKGPDRPVVPDDERAELVAGLACVDHVLVFHETDVSRVLRVVRPDVHCKGTDYRPETVPERQVAAEVGARVAIVGDPKRHATRDLIERIRRD